jgi:outer membrane protein
MKGFVYNILLLLFAGTLTVCGEENVKMKLTLEEAKAIALKQNPTLAIAQANILAAAAEVEKAAASFYPTIGIEAGLTRVRDYATRPVRDYNNDTKYSAGVTGSWMLLDAGARRFSYEIAKRGGDMAVSACDDARRTLMENVAYAFFVVVQAQNSMNIALQDAEYNRILHNDAKTRLDNGVAKPSEVLNFEFQVGNAEVNYITAERTWRNACVTLGRLLVIQSDNIWDNIELVEPDKEMLNTSFGNLQEQLDYARAHRPDYRQAQYEIVQAQLKVKLAETDYAPTVSAFYNYGFERMGSGHFNTHYDRNLNFGLALNWTLFSGFSTNASRAAAKANLEAAKQTLEQLDLTIDAEIRQNFVALESSRATYEKQCSQYEIAKKIRDLVKEEYDGGTATITRLNEVQTDLTNAALARNNAYIEVLNSIEALQSSTGHNLDN